MNITGRPSKNALYDVLEKQLRQCRGAVGVDAASADFKNRKFFCTDAYYGIDINLSALQAGIKNADAQTFGIHADLANLDALSDNSVDVLVSTYTLYHMPVTDRLQALQQVCRIVAPNGTLFVELLLDTDFDVAVSLFQKQFESVEIMYFKNRLSQWYISLFTKKDGSMSPLLFTLACRIIAWMVGKLEVFTRTRRSGNMHGLIVCSLKKGSVNRKTFDLSEVKQLGERLYSLDM